MGGLGTSDEQNGTQAAGEGLSMAGDGDQGEEEQRKSMSHGTGVYILYIYIHTMGSATIQLCKFFSLIFFLYTDYYVE